MASEGTWSKYVRNRVKAITDLAICSWHYVPTDENASDLGTRGVAPSKLNGFLWLSNRLEWPSQPEITETAKALLKALPRERSGLTGTR